MMTTTEKKSYVLDRLAELRTEVMKNVHKLPEEWEGRHLEEYLYQKALYVLSPDPRAVDIKDEVDNEIVIKNI